MDGHNPQFDALASLRTAFQQGKPVDENAIRPFILASWRRCKQSSLLGSSAYLNGLSRLSHALKRNSQLIASSAPIMEQLWSCIQDAHSIIGLADTTGLILHVVGNKTDINELAVFQKGYYATEEVTGTNGIGTGLIEKKPLEIIGNEHYMSQGSRWVCCSAPIFSGDIFAGLLNISVKLEHRNKHTLGLVQTAANAVTENLRLRKLLEEQNAMLSVLDEGVIVLAADGKVRSMNSRAQKLLGLSGNMVGQNFTRIIRPTKEMRVLLTETLAVNDREMTFRHGGGQSPLSISMAPVPDGGKVLILRTLKRMREYVTRILYSAPNYSFDKILGISEPMLNVLKIARQAAQSDITTLIRGESGTGKELFAQAIHNDSTRKDAPFVAVNCGAIPRELLESELFGYEEGAFTGARRQGKPGKFELADGGTLFLDEIGDLPLEAQVSILRAIQEGEIVRVGGTRPRRINIRIITATHRNLEEAVNQKTFRQDLYYRLNVLSITIPPLRERTGDIRVLAQHILDKFSATLGKPSACFDNEALQALEGYSWPGNVRELENVVERAINLVQGNIIHMSDLPGAIASPAKRQPPSRCLLPSAIPLLKSRELQSIIDMLEQTHGNMRVTAEKLGLSRSSLYRKLKKNGMTPQAWRRLGTQ